jgi:hypothetical protein
MDQAKFEKELEKLKKHTNPNGTWESPVFTAEDYESMSPGQLSQVALEMLKFTGAGSYWLRSDLFNFIDCLDKSEKVSISEDKNLEKYLHMTASLVCLTWLQGRIDFNDILPPKFAWFRRHLNRIIGPQPLQVPSLMETEPSLQIATFLAYPLLEGVVRRKLSKFISPDGTVLCEFEVPGRRYRQNGRISNLHHTLQLLEKETSSPALKAKLSHVNKYHPPFPEKQNWRNMLLHGELTASWHGLTILLLTYMILLEGIDSQGLI